MQRREDACRDWGPFNRVVDNCHRYADSYGPSVCPYIDATTGEVRYTVV